MVAVVYPCIITCRATSCGPTVYSRVPVTREGWSPSEGRNQPICTQPMTDDVHCDSYLPNILLASLLCVVLHISSSSLLGIIGTITGHTVVLLSINDHH